METLSVSRMHARFRLGADAGDARARLERSLRTVLDDALEQALARAGVPVHEEICVRSAHAELRIGDASADAAVVGAWSRALADSIHGVIARGGPGVVRYRTRTHALVDLLAGVAAGDLRRVWAWRQLGFWHAGESAAREVQAAEVVRALLREPSSIVGALAGAARGGALPGLVGAVPPAGWRDLARAALGAASVPSGAVAALLESAAAVPGAGPVATTAPGGVLPAGPERAAGRGAPVDGAGWDDRSPAGSDDGSPAARAADRVERSSAIARALATVPSLPPGIGRPLAVLAVLEAEPGELLRTGRHGPALAATLLARIGPDGVLGDPLYIDGSGRAAEGERSAAGGAAGPKARAAAASGREHPSRTPADRANRPPAPARDDRPAAAPAADRAAAPADAELAEDRPLPDLAVRAATEWGGLLFLLHVVGELGLPAAILADETLRGRSLRWVLHRIAVQLLDLEETDPAALAFAGVAPDAPPPWRGEERPSAAEEEALAGLAARVAARAHERLAGGPAPDARAAAATVRACARRHAELACEPGWFDARFRLDEVVVEVRRAGLDLDPGWIPWLGVVVRIVYA